MIGFYTPIILLQAFCVYHAYRNNSESRWYWLILLFPGIGCAFYLFHHFYNRKSINTITESVKEIVNSNYKVEQLEKTYRFSDTLTNRVNLADAYIECARYEEAITLYNDSLTGFMADDPGIRMKLLNAFFLNGEFENALSLGKVLESHNGFRNAEQRIAYAWALHYSGRTDSAERVFMSMDKSFTNYLHRKEYCKFLMIAGRTEDVKTKTAEILEEFEHMRGPEKRLYRDILQELRALRSSFAASNQ